MKKAAKKPLNVVENINNGKRINSIYNAWENIKTLKQHKAWEKKAGTMRFGTYKNKTIMDIIENFNPSFPSPWMKVAFYSEVTNAIKNTR